MRQDEQGIQVRRLGKSYGDRQALTELNLTVKPGQILGILGPNGSGKSTLVNLLAGIEPADEGQIWIDGKPITTFSDRQRAQQVAVLSQGGAANQPILVRDYLLMGREPYQRFWPWYQAGDHQVVDQWIERLGLEQLQHKRLDQLSGGERQLVGIGQAMVQTPRYLLLDEPTNHLDVKHQFELLNLLATLRDEHQLGILLVLHDLNLAAQYSDRLLLLHKGKWVVDGTPAEVINRQRIKQVYEIDTFIIKHPEQAVPQVLLSQGNRKVRS